MLSARAAARTTRILLLGLLLPALAYSALLAYVYAIQDQLSYQPRREFINQPRGYQLPATEHRLTTADGQRLFAWHIQAADSDHAYTLLYMHGNGGNVSYTLPALREFYQLGLNVFVFDYRGYGQSTGQPSEPGLHTDAQAAYRYLTEELQVPPERVILYGRSLGGGVAGELATRVPAAALIIESSFRSAWSVGAEIYWYLPVRWLARNRFETEERFRSLAGRLTQAGAGDGDLPVLILHGRQDRLIPPMHGRALYAAAPTRRKKFVELDGGHNNLLAVSRAGYRASLREFLAQL